MLATSILNSSPVWTGDYSKLECIDIIEETHNVKCFTFNSEQSAYFDYFPGQNITLALNIDGKTVMRTYTISSTPTRPFNISITNKRMAGGVVTNWMHDCLKIGDKIEATGINGQFSFAFNKNRKKLLFLSGGSGITPMLSSVRYLFDLGADYNIQFIHNAQTIEDFICKEEIDWIGKRLDNFASHYIPEIPPARGRTGLYGLINNFMLQGLIPDIIEREIYCCGPAPYMNAVKKALDEINFNHSHYHEESFTFSQSLVQPYTQEGLTDENDNQAMVYEVNLKKSGKKIKCDANTSLLKALRKEGVQVPFACSQGICGTCMVKKTEGEVDMNQQGGLLKRKEEQGFILSCCSTPKSNITLDL